MISKVAVSFSRTLTIGLIGLTIMGHRASFAAEDSPEKKLAVTEATEHSSAVLTLLRQKCVRCHGTSEQKAELDLSSFAGVSKGGESGAIVVPGKPDESALYEKVHSGEMPPEKESRLAEKEIELIRAWIEAGARSPQGETATKETAPLNQHDILPILLRRCTFCHGRNRQEANLDLRSTAAMLRGGKSGPAIVPGDPDKSLLIQKVRGGQMPPLERLVEASIKPIEPGEIEMIAKWIAARSPEVKIEPDVATTEQDPLVSEKDREFWAFRAPQPVTVPAIKSDQIRNEIDAFVLKALREKGLEFAQEADKATLIRRATYDVTGLPPNPADVEAFIASSDPQAYERLIDKLLESPRYGERWARFWLDAAGYADSEGKREQDLPRPYAWRYRDYVIRSLNADKPYDRFLTEQLAGDELTDYEKATEITQEISDNLVATGFLRMTPDATWANITGYLPDRIEIIADEMDVLGSTVLGLSLKCARCHSHKFDPIPQRDYYRVLDVFKGALDENDWLKPDIRPGIGPVSTDVVGGRLLPYIPTAERTAWESNESQISQQITALNAQLAEKTKSLANQVREERITLLPEGERDVVRAMLATPADKLDNAQKQLAEKYEKEFKLDRESLKAQVPQFKTECEELEKQIKSAESRRTPESKIHALWDRGEPTPTYIYRRGDPFNLGRLVGPGVISVLTDGKTPFEVNPPASGAKTTGRRLAFAKWLTQPDHPLTARVAVNRLWKHHFGMGIVKTLGNFGKAGIPPTHPELLDWMALKFLQNGWSMKSMHRLMLTSRTYRQSSAVTPKQKQIDPDNTWLSRMPMQRLDAESLYDALLLVSGQLDETRFGPADAIQSQPDGLVMPVGTSHGWRRLIYVKQMRKQIVTHMENFDFPQMNPNCIERRDSTVAPQALHLMNNGMVQQLAERFAARVHRETGDDRSNFIRRAYLLAISRPSTEEEEKLGTQAIVQLEADWNDQLTATGKPDAETAKRNALVAYCHALMNSASFLYVD